MSKLELVARVPEAEQHETDVEGVTIRDGKVFTCADDGKVKIYDMNLKLIKEFKAHDYAVYDVFVFGNTLFTGSIDTTIKTWDVNTLEHKKTIEKHEMSVRKFCTDGKLVFAGDEKGEVRGYTEDGEPAVWYSVVEEVWGLHAQEDLLYSIRDRGLTITEVKGEDNKFAHFTSIDGRAPLYARGDYLVFPDTAGMTLQVFDNNKKTTFARKGTMKGHELIITALGGWGDRAVSGGYGSELRLWDLKKFAEIGKCAVPEVPNGIAATEQGDIFVVGVGGYVCKLKGA